MPTEVPHQPLPLDQTDVRYAHGPDSVIHRDVPTGITVECTWDERAGYPGTFRRFWVHLPAHHDRAERAALHLRHDRRLGAFPDSISSGNALTP
jgi:enterochelin esterase family protein